MRNTRRHGSRPGAVLLASSLVAAALVAIPSTASALDGVAEYQPVESNIAGKYWVDATASSGDAGAAVDGDLGTAWVAPAAPATLTLDLGGAYDAVHKVQTVFSSDRAVYTYRLDGTTDGRSWVTLADRTHNTRAGAVFTDVLTLRGLTGLRLTVTGGSPVGVRELRVLNYLRPDLDNGSDSSEQGGNTNAYYYNAGNDPAVPGVRGGAFSDPGSIESGNNYFGLTKDLGWDTTRLRVWNEPRNENNGNPTTSAGNNSPENTRRVAKAVVGAGQNLAIDLHYADSWADPQNQPKPYAWADLSFDDLQQAVYDYTYDLTTSLVDQGTTPTIVALGNEITNGMMWGSEYDEITPYVHHHDYYTSGRYAEAPGGGVEWLKYEEADGDTSSPAYQEFLESVKRLSLLIDAGNRAVARVNTEKGTHIDTQLHFAFNVFEQPTGQPKVELDPQEVFQRVQTLISQLNSNLSARGGMVDRIGLSYYPDWHGTYDTVQRNLVEISKMLPDLTVSIVECSPKASGTVTDPLADPNHPVGFEYSVQSQGDDAADIMTTVNDVPNNAGTGVWPWAGTNVFGVGRGENATLRASFKVWNDAFAKNVLESGVFASTSKGLAPALPMTVTSLDLATGQKTQVPVAWDAVPAASYATEGSFTVHGTARVTVPAAGRGKAMTDVEATVAVLPVATVSAPAPSKASQAYGSVTALQATLTSQVSGTTSGTVTFRSGTRVLGSASVVRSGAGYAATLRLPATLPVGSYSTLTAALAVPADGRTAVSVASAATFQVVKATAKKVKVTGKKFKAGTKPKVKVKVGKLSSGQKPVGKIKVYVGKKVVKTAKLKAKKNGKITVKLPKKYRSTIKVKATFVPKDKTVVKTATSKAVKVKAKGSKAKKKK